MAFSSVAILAVTGLIVFGTTTSLFGKIIYDLEAIGPDGDKQYFRKPWMMTLVMFVGMSFCLPIAMAKDAATRAKQKKELLQQPLLGTDQPPARHSELKKVLMLSIPTIFDLIATVLMNVGLLSVTASVYQMMRGAEMLFAALFAVMFLGRKLNVYHYGGITACTVGIALVGVSSVLAGEGSQTVHVSSEQIVLGMALIVASQCVQAAQITFEDFFMSDMDIQPLTIVGYEGLFGVLMMILVMMPIAYLLPGQEGEGLHENSLHTFWLLGHNPHILGIICFMAFALLMYNVAGMNVTGELGAVFRTVLETMRTLFVWVIDLILHEGFGLKIGESWSKWSWIQLAGFVVLVSGTIIYSKGDDRDVQKMAADDILAGSGSAGAATITQPLLAGARAPSATQPIHMSVGSVTGKSTMAINTFSSSLRPSSYMGPASLRAGSTASHAVPPQQP